MDVIAVVAERKIGEAIDEGGAKKSRAIRWNK